MVVAVGHGEDEPGSPQPVRAPGGRRRRTAPGRGRCRPSRPRRPGAPSGSTPIATQGTASFRLRRGTGGGAGASAARPTRLGLADAARWRSARSRARRLSGWGARPAGGGRATCAHDAGQRLDRPWSRRRAGAEGLPVVRRRRRPRGAPSRSAADHDPAHLEAGHLPDSTPCSSTGSAPRLRSRRVSAAGSGGSAGGDRERRWRRAGTSDATLDLPDGGRGRERRRPPGQQPRLAASASDVERRAALLVGPGQGAAEAPVGWSSSSTQRLAVGAAAPRRRAAG